MVSLIPELITYIIRYGMMLEKAYQEERYDISEDLQETNPEKEKRLVKIKEVMDKFSLYL